MYFLHIAVSGNGTYLSLIILFNITHSFAHGEMVSSIAVYL